MPVYQKKIRTNSNCGYILNTFLNHQISFDVTQQKKDGMNKQTKIIISKIQYLLSVQIVMVKKMAEKYILRLSFLCLSSNSKV